MYLREVLLHNAGGVVALVFVVGCSQWLGGVDCVESVSVVNIVGEVGALSVITVTVRVVLSVVGVVNVVSAVSVNIVLCSSSSQCSW